MKNELIVRQNEFMEMFAELGCWQERFQYLIDLGDELPDMPEHLRTLGNRIEGCISRTYFYPWVSNGLVRIQGWSNAAIPSGLIALIREIFEGCSVEDMNLLPAIAFHTESGLMDHLTGQRAAALQEMIHRLEKL